MDKSTRILLFLAPVIGSLGFTFANPIINVHFVPLVGSNILALANIITTSLAALVNASIPIESVKAFYRRHFLLIIATDCIGFCAVCMTSIEYPEARFLGCAVVNAVSQTLWFTIIKDAVNHKLSGDDLTDFSSQVQTLSLIASLLGSVLAFFLTSIDVEICLAIQCISNVLCGITDWKAYKKLGNGIYEAPA